MTETEQCQECLFRAAQAVVAEAFRVRVASLRMNTDMEKGLTSALEFVKENKNPAPFIAGTMMAAINSFETIHPSRIARDTQHSAAAVLALKHGDKEAAKDLLYRTTLDVAEVMDLLRGTIVAVANRLAETGYMTGADVRQMIDTAAGQSPKEIQ